MSSLKNKAVIVTGASTGIGAGIAIHLASLGCRLSLAARNLDNLKKTAESCQRAGLSSDKILLIPADLTKDDDVRQVMEKTINKFGRLDVLVNNAGTATAPSNVQDMTHEDYDTIMNLNVRSVFFLTQLAIPHLIKTQGNIVNISSAAGMKVFRGVTAYCMSKAALDHFTRGTASELAEHNVRVNGINPGYISTPLHQKAFPGVTDEMMNAVVQKSAALGRMGKVEEIAKVVAFVASDDGSYMTGVTLPVDGGVLVRTDPIA